MAILRYFPILFPAILLTGCYEDFNPEIDTNPVLCINSLITAGEPIDVSVTHTWTYNDVAAEENHTVSDAAVTIIVNDNIVDSSHIPAEGDKIRIIAESAKYGKATAEVSVPYSTAIGKVKFTPTVTDIWQGIVDEYHPQMSAEIRFNLTIEMDINDPGEIDNFYLFGYNWFDGYISDDLDDELYGGQPPMLSIGTFEYDAEPIFGEHIGVFETIMGNDEFYDFNFFTDRQFSGKKYTLHLNFKNCAYRVNSQVYDEALLECGVNLFLTNVSRSYYNWAVYKWNVDEGIMGDLSDIGLAESKWGYSNVSTGAGVVAAQSSSTYTIDLKDFLKSVLSKK